MAKPYSCYRKQVDVLKDGSSFRHCIVREKSLMMMIIIIIIIIIIIRNLYSAIMPLGGYRGA